MGLFWDKREKVEKIRAKERKEILTSRREERERLSRERKRETRERELEGRAKLLESEASFYEAKARKKQAKRATGVQWPSLPTVRLKVKKKKQSRKLSRSKRIGLI